MKTPISQVLFQTSCSQYSLIKHTEKYSFFINGRICGFCVIKRSIKKFLEYLDLTKANAARLFTNYTFVLQSISKWKFLIIFYCTEVLLPRDSESNRTHIFLEQAGQSVQKKLFRNVRKEIYRKGNVVAPNLSNISGRKCL